MDAGLVFWTGLDGTQVHSVNAKKTNFGWVGFGRQLFWIQLHAQKTQDLVQSKKKIGAICVHFCCVLHSKCMASSAFLVQNLSPASIHSRMARQTLLLQIELSSTAGIQLAKG